MDFTLADATRIIGAKRRTVQHWAATGVILADPETDRSGTGVHRRFSRDEVMIGCLVHAFSLELQMSIGALLQMSRLLRAHLQKGTIRAPVEDAVANRRAVYVLLKRSGQAKEGSSPFTVSIVPAPFPQTAVDAFGLLGRNVVEHLENYGGFTAVVMANPYLQGLA